MTQPKPMLSARVDPELAERARRAVYWQRITMQELVTDAVERVVAKAEKANGGPFDPIPGGDRLTTGPRPGTQQRG